MLMSVALPNVRMPLYASTTGIRTLGKSLYAQKPPYMTGHITPSSPTVIHHEYMLFYTKKWRSYTLLA
jgi:hypothetical protein